MGQSPSAYKGIDPSHVRVADGEGSLVLDFPDGVRVVAALPGSYMYQLGHYLSSLNTFEDLLIRESQKISRPLPFFTSRSSYIDVDDDDDDDDDYRHHTDRNGETSGTDDDGRFINKDTTVVKGKERVLSEDIDPESGVSPMDNLHSAPISDKPTDERDRRFIEECRLKEAIKQRKIHRLVSQYPVQLSTPFVDEFYERIVSPNSPYSIFDSSLISVYRLWCNTSTHNLVLSKAIREFLLSKQRLGPLWSVDTLESFLVCYLHTEGDLAHVEPNIEPQDYDIIEKRMMIRLNDQLAKISRIKRLGGLADDKGNMVAPPPTDEELASGEGSLSTKSDTEGSSDAHTFEYGIPRSVYFMQKREELEIERMARYYEKKRSVLKKMYAEPSEYERVSNPFYKQLEAIQQGNQTGRVVDKLASPRLPHSTTRMSSYRNIVSTSTTKGTSVNGDGISPDRLRRDQDLLQSVLEALLASNQQISTNWYEYMECQRKIIIEVRDIVRQVRENQNTAKRLLKEGRNSSKENLLAPVTVPMSAESGTEDTEQRTIPSTHTHGNDDDDYAVAGELTGPGVRDSTNLLEKDSHQRPKSSRKISQTTIKGPLGDQARIRAIQAKLIWGDGSIPLEEEDGVPIGPYSPDRPHLPDPTVDRLEFLLEAAHDCLTRSLMSEEMHSGGGGG